jgi:hypothetical protein
MAFKSIIGVDCATTPDRTGLARVRRSASGWQLTELHGGSRDLDRAGVVTTWLEEEPRSLLALDAPLGWPTALGSMLAQHRAGEPAGEASSYLFARTTDRHVEERYGKKPLEVGASWIARTAVAALELLDEVRRHSNLELPLWWPDANSSAAAAVEVYPAATLRAHPDVASKGYREAGTPGRRRVIDLLRLSMTWSRGADPHSASSHGVDAALCALAGIDVVDGHSLPPDQSQREDARREGWIWVHAG